MQTDVVAILAVNAKLSAIVERNCRARETDGSVAAAEELAVVGKLDVWRRTEGIVVETHKADAVLCALDLERPCIAGIVALQ